MQRPDHDHQEYWRQDSQFRFEDRMATQLEKLNDKVDTLIVRLSLFMGAILLLTFLIPLVLPFLRSAFGLG